LLNVTPGWKTKILVFLGEQAGRTTRNRESSGKVSRVGEGYGGEKVMTYAVK